MKSATAAAALSLLPPSFSLTISSHKSQLWTFINPTPSLPPQNHTLSPPLRRPIRWARYRRRDSITGDNDKEDDDDDFGQKRRRRRRRWWSDDSPSDMDQGPGIVEEFIDSVWILKVFGSYGWLLSAFIISILTATGPKAFLMALALPIGQSAFTLAFKKLWGKKKNNPKSKTRTNKKARARTARKVEFEEEEELEESQGTRKGAVGYRSWVARDDVSVDTDSPNSPSFGGWDDLDGTKEFDMGSFRKSARTSRSGEKGKFSRREGKSEMPLLLRLLIAVFPFLGSWTRML